MDAYPAMGIRDGDVISASVMLRNSAEVPISVSARIILRGNAVAEEFASTAIYSIPGVHVTTFRFQVRDREHYSTSYIILKHSENIKLVSPKFLTLVARSDPAFIIFVLVVVVIMSICTLALALRHVGESSPDLGSATWEPGQSWASNFSAIGTTIGGALLIAVAPEQTVLLPKSTYLALNVWAATLVAMAPVVFNLWRNSLSPDRSVVIGFAVACFMTMVGAQTQMSILSLVFEELFISGVLGAPFFALLWGIIIISSVLLVIYFYSSIQRITSAPAPASDLRAGFRARDWALL